MVPPLACPARGGTDQGPSGIHARQGQRVLWTPCHTTCTATTGPGFSRRAATVGIVATTTRLEGRPLRELAERLRTPLCEPGGTFRACNAVEQDRLKPEATTLADACQRSRAHREGRHGSLALRSQAWRGLANPGKRTCLTAVHHGLLKRPDGTTAAERFFEQKPRSMFTAILAQ